MTSCHFIFVLLLWSCHMFCNPRERIPFERSSFVANLAFQVLLALVKRRGFHGKCFLPSSHCCTKFCCPGPTRLWVMAILPHLLYFQTFMELRRVGSCSFQSLSRVRLFATPWTAAPETSQSITNSWSLLKLNSSNQWYHPTISSSVIPFSSCLQSFPASGSFQMSQFFASGGLSIGSFSFSISPCNVYSGLISFRIDWFDFFAVQRTLKSPLQDHSSKASILWYSAFFIVQLSHPYVTTGKIIALTRQIFIGKVMSLLFNILSKLVIAFLPRRKRLLISWLQSPSAVILEPKKIKSVTVSIVFPSICCEVIGPDAMIFIFWMLSFKPTLDSVGTDNSKPMHCNLIFMTWQKPSRTA